MSQPTPTKTTGGPLDFEVQHRDGRARAAVMTLGGMRIETPVFMPVGTRACVRTLDVDDLEALGYRLVLANTYHLMLRPGGDFLDEMGGVQKFWGWRGRVLTDSGGFQVFSLAHLTKKNDKGVTFRSHLDGDLYELTPERSIDEQVGFGSDIVMAFDECLPWPLERAEAKTLTRRSTRWTQRSHARFLEARKPHQSFFGITQGGEFDELRVASSQAMIDLGCDGYAIGGLAIGEPKEVMRAQVEVSDGVLPEDRPRYLMGVGKPPDILDAVLHGVDMFDCVHPTRAARHAHLYVRGGRLNLRNARFRADAYPVEEGCPCPTCRRHSRAYLHHLFKSKEDTGARLATLHNLTHYRRLMQGAREAIRAGRFEAYRREYMEARA